MQWFYLGKKKNRIFTTSWHGIMNNLDELLNQRHLYCVQLRMLYVIEVRSYWIKKTLSLKLTFGEVLPIDSNVYLVFTWVWFFSQLFFSNISSTFCQFSLIFLQIFYNWNDQNPIVRIHSILKNKVWIQKMCFFGKGKSCQTFAAFSKMF